MKTYGNDTAYPAAPAQNYEETINVGGLTKREYFAAMAMSGMIGKKHGHVDGCDGNGNNVDAIECAVLAVSYADALIEQLNKNQGN